MLIHSIYLQGFLSYGEESSPIELRNLNVIIGTNGSGKSNLIEAFDLLRAAPRDIRIPIRDGGGVRDWLYKGGKSAATAKIEAVVDNTKGRRRNLRYSLCFTEEAQSFVITDERVEDEFPDRPDKARPYFYYTFQGGRGMLNVRGRSRKLQGEEIDPLQSILSQRKDPDHYPEITYLGNVFTKIRLYRNWSFGRYTPPRLPQKTDLPNDVLEPNAENLSLVLNSFQGFPRNKAALMGALQELYSGISDYYVKIEGGTAQLFLLEGERSIPATRLSDGTLRYLCLLSVLCHPTPPPLVCIEEPELGLHPDVLPTLANLLKDASERCQLIITTHSDTLVDALTDTPESVIVAEKIDGGTNLQRLSGDELKPWLEEYRLGQLWSQGHIGGTRW